MTYAKFIETQELLIDYMNGHSDAFETLVYAYKDKAESFAKRYLKVSHYAEDVVQEAFATTYIKRQEFKLKYSYKTYLFTIVRNKCIDIIRKEVNESILPKNENVSYETPESFLIEREQTEYLYQVIDQLNHDYKSAIYLVDIEGLSYKEAARVLDKSLGAFKVSLMRARRSVKKSLEMEGM